MPSILNMTVGRASNQCSEEQSYFFTHATTICTQVMLSNEENYCICDGFRSFIKEGYFTDHIRANKSMRMCSTKWYAKQISSQHITAKQEQMVNIFDIFEKKINILVMEKGLEIQG